MSEVQEHIETAVEEQPPPKRRRIAGSKYIPKAPYVEGEVPADHPTGGPWACCHDPSSPEGQRLIAAFNAQVQQICMSAENRRSSEYWPYQAAYALWVHNGGVNPKHDGVVYPDGTPRVLSTKNGLLRVEREYAMEYIMHRVNTGMSSASVR